MEGRDKAVGYISNSRTCSTSNLVQLGRGLARPRLIHKCAASRAWKLWPEVAAGGVGGVPASILMDSKVAILLRSLQVRRPDRPWHGPPRFIARFSDAPIFTGSRRRI